MKTTRPSQTTNPAELISLDRDAADSLIEQLIKQFQALINNGTLIPGSKIPSSTQLAKEIGVAYKTLESALNQLGRSGYLRRIKNKGSFIAQPQPTPQPASPATSDSNLTIKILLPVNMQAPDPGNPPLAWYNFIDITNSIVAAAYQQGIRAESVYVSDYQQVKTCVNQPNTAAFFFASSGRIRHVIDFVREQEIPYVCHGPMNTVNDSLNAIIVNVRKGAFETTERIIKAGHDRIAFIYRDVDTDPWFRPKLAGFKAALAAHNLPFDPNFIIHAGLQPGDAYQATYEKLKTIRPTAIFSSNDLFAHEAIQAVQAAGLRVPEEIAIVGFDDIPQSADSSIALSATTFPRCEIGKMAVKMLMLLAEQPELSPLVKVIDTGFVYRNTFLPLHTA